MDDRVATIKARYPLAEIIPRYATGERSLGGRTFWCCPFHAERTPSFSITPDGMRWICFAGCGTGDVIDFIQRVEGTDWKGAVAILTGGEFTPSARPVQARTTEERDASREKLREAARRIWRESRPGDGTAVETYLRARGITLPVPPTLRFHPGLKHRYSGLVFPAMVAPFQDAGGRFLGVHRTFLARDGRGKADVEKPKLALAPVRGGSVRLGPEPAHLIVAEGIETALSGMQARGLVAWASCSSPLMRAMELPFGVGEVTILADGDPAGIEAADAAAERWLAEGRRVNVAEIPLEPA